jgi:glycogen debranching enzyme
MDVTNLRTTIYNTILELSTDDGINASGKGEVYGCIFGRDSAITILKILKVLRNTSANSYFEVYQLQEMCRRALIRLTELQGKESNPESGEEPGKFIHEYRTSNYERLLKLEKPWYVYPDGILRNYDSLDSTPMALIAIYKFWEQTGDNEFLLRVLPSVEAGLNWIITYGDTDKDQLVEYELSPNRKYGGLPVQSWTDSHTCLLNEKGKMPLYPIAPVEVQGYMWLALKLWADFYLNSQGMYAHSEHFAKKLLSFAAAMKKQFNEMFIMEDADGIFLAQALDGEKKQLRKITGNPLLVLWATYNKDDMNEAILDNEYIPHIVTRAFQSDLFEPDAGIRTLSTKSFDYNPNRDSYHNGSFWPKLNGMSHEGLMNWNFLKEAEMLKEATLKPIIYFGTPIELYVKNEDGSYHVYLGEDGQEGCRNQAWSAAAALDLLTL